jgi:hypothetical protein
MRRQEGGTLDRRTRQRALRVIGMVLAVALGIVAVWLIVTSNNVQRTKIGALAGFWALLFAAYPVLGMRHPQVIEVGSELDIRPSGRLERTEDAAERLEYERRLQLMVRHEIQTALGSEIASLRSEVAALRSEILEKVGGQIRLERIETTRMIGSDIEALQHEVRQLKVANNAGDLTEFAVDATLAQSMDDAVTRQLAAAEAEHAARLQHVAAQVADLAAAQPVFAEVVEDEPAPAAAQEPEPEPEPAAPAPVAAPAAKPVAEPSGDPFEAMPRISPFTDFDLDNREEHGSDPAYAGRRRRNGETPVPVPGGRHAGEESDWASARPGGGRRHREEDGEDILARILQREGLRN